MRHVDLETFLKMPAGTVYMIAGRDGGSIIYDLGLPLEIKGTSLNGVNDWNEFELIEMEGDEGDSTFSSLIDGMIKEDKSVPIDAEPVGSRYGMYPKQGEISFFILDKEDTRRVIGLLEMALRWQEGKS